MSFITFCILNEPFSEESQHPELIKQALSASVPLGEASFVATFSLFSLIQFYLLELSPFELQLGVKLEVSIESVSSSNIVEPVSN